MTPLVLVMTKAGLARINAAQSGQPVDFRVAAVALSDAPFVAAPTLGVVPGEHRRLATVSGINAGDNITHMVVRDDDAIGYGVRGFGIYLADGTLLATYAQADRLVQKSPAASLNLAIDIAFTGGVVAALTFGETNFLNPPATTAMRGVVELATDAEADAGTPGLFVITARQLRRAVAAIGQSLQDLADDVADDIAAFKRNVAESLAAFGRRKVEGDGLVTGGGDLTADRKLKVTAATGADTRTGTSDTTAVTPAGLASAGAVFVVAQDPAANGGYRVWSDGLKECWGSVGVPAGQTVTVPLPTPHDSYCVPTGSCSIAQDEASIGALNANAAGFDVRNRNPMPTTFYWHTKGR